MERKELETVEGFSNTNDSIGNIISSLELQIEYLKQFCEKEENDSNNYMVALLHLFEKTEGMVERISDFSENYRSIYYSLRRSISKRFKKSGSYIYGKKVIKVIAKDYGQNEFEIEQLKNIEEV